LRAAAVRARGPARSLGRARGRRAGARVRAARRGPGRAAGARHRRDPGGLSMDRIDAWLRVCAIEEIPVLGARVLRRGDGDDIALFRPAPDRVFALADRCPHKRGPLSQGIVAGDIVTCPLHGWNIQLDSGQACAPDVGCARRYPVQLRDGHVWLSLFALAGEEVHATSAAPAPEATA